MTSLQNLRCQLERRSSIIVWAVWLVMTVAALCFVFRYGSNVPYMDEWDFVPHMTGKAPVTVEFLWSQHNEHRLPLSKLYFIFLGRWAHGELRLLLALNVLLLASIAALLIQTARRLRGFTHWTDLFFPLAFLHWGHWEVLLMSFLFQFIASTGLAVVVLSTLVGRRLPSIGQSLLIGSCLVVLTLLGMNGLILVPFLGLWLAGVGAAHWNASRYRNQRWKLAGLFAFLTLAVVLTVLTFVNYHKPPHHPQSPGAWATLLTALQFLGMSVGAAGNRFWPYASVFVAVLCLATVGRLIWLWRERRLDRFRISGVLFFLAAAALLAVSIGWGRAGLGGDAGFAVRYSLLSLLALVGVYFANLLIRGRLAGWIQAGLCLAVAGSLYWDVTESMPHVRARRNMIALFKSDLANGAPADKAAERYQTVLHPHLAITVDGLEMLRQKKMGPFQKRSGIDLLARH